MEREGTAKEALLLLVLERFGPMGRKHLGEALNLPEGVVRGLVSRLRARGWVSVRPDGCQVSARGEESLRAALAGLRIESLKESAAGNLGIGPVVVSVQVRAAAGKVRSGIEQRDVSVRGGAKGAVTLTYRDGVLSMPGVSGNLSDYSPLAAESVLSSFSLEEDDVVLLVFADDYYRAYEGALVAARSLSLNDRQVGPVDA